VAAEAERIEGYDPMKYATAKEVDGVEADQHKCNLLLADAAAATGDRPPLMHGGNWLYRLSFGLLGHPTTPPVQLDWSLGRVPGWRIVNDDIQRGDILTNGVHGAIATHPENEISITVNTTALYGGRVQISNWGFRSNEPAPTVLRYFGDY
jgi:hypothetical protein